MVGVVPDGYQVLQEGAAKVLYAASQAKSGGTPVFYNKAQVVNRDLSVAVLRRFTAHRKGLRVLEALSATGLRALRYHFEVDGLGKIVANDLDAVASEAIQRNVKYMDVPDNKISVTNMDAVDLMSSASQKVGLGRFDIIDLDPYGTAVPFLDSAIRALNTNGLLCVTCTDLAVLCGSNSEACFPRYGSAPLRGPFTHEFAVRTVLSTIQTTAARYGRNIIPLACFSIDFYVRLFIQVGSSKNECNKAPTRSALVYACTQCKDTHLQRLGSDARAGGANSKNAAAKFTPARGPPTPENNVCQHCSGNFQVGGPIWSAPIYQREFVDGLVSDLSTKGKNTTLKALDRVQALVRSLSEELIDVPLFMQHSLMAKTLRVVTPPLPAMRDAISSAGYRVSSSHTDPLALKTDAPTELLWDVYRWWAEEHPPTKLQADSAGRHILASKPRLITDRSKLDFTVKSKSKSKDAVRFPVTPANWGPIARATGEKRPPPESEPNSDTQPPDAKTPRKLPDSGPSSLE